MKLSAWSGRLTSCQLFKPLKSVRGSGVDSVGCSRAIYKFTVTPLNWLRMLQAHLEGDATFLALAVEILCGYINSF